MEDRLSAVLKQFIVITDNGKIEDVKTRKNFELQMKTNIRDIVGWVQRIKEFSADSSTMNLLRLKEDFEKKVSLTYVRWQSLDQNISNLTKQLRLR